MRRLASRPASTAGNTSSFPRRRQGPRCHARHVQTAARSTFRKRAKPVELNPAQHPRLYQFIAHLCDLLRVRVPGRIYLDRDLNASAGLRRGALSFFGNNLVLTVGLPLVAGLNTRQFAAVIAHELGHCTQALAMRLGYVIDGVNRWFSRVVYERDTWDEALAEWSDSVEDWRLSLIVACIHLAVWLSRKVLALLMLAGHAASCFLSRQMEYHVDACAMVVAPSAGLDKPPAPLAGTGGVGTSGLRRLPAPLEQTASVARQRT